MPELPDVEAFRCAFADHGLNRKIEKTDLRVADILHGATRGDLESALTGRRFTDVSRYGKVLFAKTDKDKALVMHFGMTGDVAFYDEPEDEPEHARLVLAFEDGGHFAFDNQRKFGWLELTDDVDEYLEEQELGPDALKIGQDRFYEVIGGTRGALKPALMKQEKLAGIGNEYSDEILFQARLSPTMKGTDLSDEQLDKLYDTMRDVLDHANDALCSGRSLPSDWISRHREKGEECPRCGGPLMRKKISGRTAYYCPECQSTD